jgi:hypothetical protein
MLLSPHTHLRSPAEFFQLHLNISTLDEVVNLFIDGADLLFSGITEKKAMLPSIDEVDNHIG